MSERVQVLWNQGKDGFDVVFRGKLPSGYPVSYVVRDLDSDPDDMFKRTSETMTSIFSSEEIDGLKAEMARQMNDMMYEIDSNHVDETGFGNLAKAVFPWINKHLD